MSSLSQRKGHSPPPFRPSRLSIASGPYSPAEPLTPPDSCPSSPLTFKIACPPSPPAVTVTPPAPQRPLPWLWTCHQCGTTYPLAATRRCLSDGHYFCSGTTYNPRTGRTKRHRSCSSEFDYVGWHAWSEWRDDCNMFTVIPHSRTHSHAQASPGKGCWDNCNYPSECRWGAKAQSPVSPEEEDELVPLMEHIEQTEPSVPVVSQAAKDDIVEQVVKAVRKRHSTSLVPTLSPIEEEEVGGLLLMPDSTANESGEPTSLSPTSPLKQHYSLPTFDFPSPPQSHLPSSLFTLAEVDDEDDEDEGGDDLYATYMSTQVGTNTVVKGQSGSNRHHHQHDMHMQGDWMDLSSSSDEDDEEDAESLVSTPSSASSTEMLLGDGERQRMQTGGSGIRILDYQRTNKGFEVFIEEIDAAE